MNFSIVPTLYQSSPAIEEFLPESLGHRAEDHAGLRTDFCE